MPVRCLRLTLGRPTWTFALCRADLKAAAAASASCRAPSPFATPARRASGLTPAITALTAAAFFAAAAARRRRFGACRSASASRQPPGLAARPQPGLASLVYDQLASAARAASGRALPARLRPTPTPTPRPPTERLRAAATATSSRTASLSPPRRSTTTKPSWDEDNARPSRTSTAVTTGRLAGVGCALLQDRGRHARRRASRTRTARRSRSSTSTR